MHTNIAAQRYYREIIRKWRFISFTKKMARKKMELMYKNLHTSYLQMADDIFGEDKVNPSVWKEFERFGSNVGMFTGQEKEIEEELNKKYYSTIDKKYTGLPVDLRLDEIGSQRTPKLIYFSEPLLTFQNSYDGRIYTDVLPMSLSQNPRVLEDDEFIKIKPEDVEAVKQFVVQHHDLLMKHWRQEITTTELHNVWIEQSIKLKKQQ